MFSVVGAGVAPLVERGVLVGFAVVSRSSFSSSGPVSTTADAAHGLRFETIAVPEAAPVLVLLVVYAVFAIVVKEAGVGVHAFCCAICLFGRIWCNKSCCGIVFVSNSLITTTADAAHIVGDKAIAVPAATPVWVGLVVAAVLIPVVHGAVVGIDASVFGGVCFRCAWHAVIESAYGPRWVFWRNSLPFLLVPPEAFLFWFLFWFFPPSIEHLSLTTTADAAHGVGNKAIAVPAATPGRVVLVVFAVLIPVVHGAIVSVDAGRVIPIRTGSGGCVPVVLVEVVFQVVEVVHGGVEVCHGIVILTEISIRDEARVGV